MSAITIPQGSIEYLTGTLTASHTLNTQPLEVAILTTSGAVDEDDWAAATWTGAAGTTRAWQILLDGTLEVGAHYVKARLADSPETPIVDLGMLWIR